MTSSVASTPQTIATTLATALSRGLGRLDAQLLLLHALGHTDAGRAWLLAHDSDPLDTASCTRFDALCAQRMAGVPVAYLTGSRGFYGMTLRVDARVLDPRPDTETLVDWALDLLPESSHARILDLGTGSGAIALALAQNRKQAEVWASDTSADALDVARANAARLALPVHFLLGDWFAPLSAPAFHLILSNPPYVATGDPHLRALTAEPLSALASGTDGLDDLRILCAQASRHLTPDGWLLLEHGWDQAERVRALLQENGFEDVQSRRDLAGVERCSGGRRPTGARNQATTG